MVSRRTFLKYTARGVLTLFGIDKINGIPKALAAVPGGTLDPVRIEKFQTPLYVLPVMPRTGKRWFRGGRHADYYEISVKEFSQQMLPPGLPSTRVWGYGSAEFHGRRASAHHTPGF